jgi:hypothetical protein
MNIVDCLFHETSGAGTTDLVLARRTSAEVPLTRFRLYTGDAQVNWDGVALAARGDTLLAAIVLTRGGTTPVLRYLEIDATRLQ